MVCKSSVTIMLLFAFVALWAASFGQASSQLEQPLSKNDDQSGIERMRVVSFPGSRLTRLFTGLNDGPASSFKRASSLDTLSGMMPIGKRSGNYPIEFVNLEPLYSRQYNMRSFPRNYDLRWTPLDSSESQYEAK